PERGLRRRAEPDPALTPEKGVEKRCQTPFPPKWCQTPFPAKWCQTPFSEKMVSDTFFGHLFRGRARSCGTGSAPSEAQAPRDPVGRVDQPVLEEPGPREARIAAPPRAGRSLSKAVAPRVHVGEGLLAPEARQIVGEQHLQIAHGAFLERVAARVLDEAPPPVRAHADVMAELVQQRVHRRV